MPRDRDGDSASSTSGQSKRPALNHQESDTQSESSNQQHHQQQQHRRHYQKQHHVGRLHHARAPVAKVSSHAHGLGHAHGSKPKLNRRHTEPAADDDTGTGTGTASSSQRPSASASAVGLSSAVQSSSSHSILHADPKSGSHSHSHSHRRVASDAKLSSRDSSSAHLVKSSSHSKLKRNRSHVEIGKRNKSTDKLKRTSSNTNVYATKSTKGQVHFDLGDDDDDHEDEWVDASGSNSPYLSRKGSINSSGQSSVRQSGTPTGGSRPVTPNEKAALEALHGPSPSARVSQPPPMSTPDRERAHHQEYLTSRLLKRIPSHGAPPKMTADLAQATASRQTSAPREFAPASADDLHDSAATILGSNNNGDELTSRFVEPSNSALTSEGSFYRSSQGDYPRFSEAPKKPRSVTSLPATRDDSASTTDDPDDSALAPKTSRRTVALPAEISRTQQKLNLQRASSVIEPAQSVAGVAGVNLSTPLLGIPGAGYDGGNSRDPRVGKLLERTGMEYLVVRRYQNPVARSLNRLHQLPGVEGSRRINGKRPGTSGTNELVVRHTRNVSMPDARSRPVTPASRRPTSIRTNGGASSYEAGADDDARLSGASLVGGEEEDGVPALLRALWDKSAELSASTD